MALGLTIAALVIAAPCALAQSSAPAPPPVGALGGRLDRAADGAADAVADAPVAEGAVGEVYEDGVGLLSYSVKVIALLGALCALGFLVVKLAGSRLGTLGGRAGDPIRVRAMKRLDAKTTLYLVDVAGQAALVGVSDREVRALSRLNLPPSGGEEVGAAERAESVGGESPAQEDSGGSRFEALLGKKALRRGRTEGSSG